MLEGIRLLTEAETKLVTGAGMSTTKATEVGAALGSAYSRAQAAGNYSLSSILAGTHNKVLLRAGLGGGIAGAAGGVAYSAGYSLGDTIYDDYNVQILDAMEWTMGHVNSAWDSMFGGS